MGFLTWLVEKLVVYAMVIGFFYIIGESLGIVPKPLKDLVTWISLNFAVIMIFVCFLSTLYVVYQLSKMKNKE